MKLSSSSGLTARAGSLREHAARRSRLPSMRRAALYTAFACASLTAGAAMAQANSDAAPEAAEAERNANAKLQFHALTIKLYHIIQDKIVFLTN